MKLVAFAIALVAAVLLWQTAEGGGDFVGLEPRDPCVERRVGTIPSRLEPLAERIVLTGLDEAACALSLSRERLVLALGDPDQRAEVDPDAIQDGLVRGVERLGTDLPPVSELLGEALDLTNLPGIVQDAVDALPDGLVDDLLPTGELLRRAVQQLDVAAVLADLQDPAALEPALRDAILAAAKDQIVSGLPSPLRDLVD